MVNQTPKCGDIDEPIPKSCPRLRGKVEAYNKIVKNEFLAVEVP
jgi:hypothetical protein